MADVSGDVGLTHDGHRDDAASAIRGNGHDVPADLGRDHLRVIFETAGLMVWQMDPETNLVSASGNAEAVIGFPFPATSDEITALIHPDDRAMVIERFGALSHGEQRVEIEYRLVAPDGRVVWAHSRGVRIDDGREVRIAGITQNITRRKRAEDALRESEARYRSLFDSIDEGFCIIAMQFDRHGAPRDYVFLQVNPAFEGQTGLREAVGRSIRELVPDLEQHWFDIYGGVATTGEPVRFVHQAKGLDGRWFSVNAFRVDDPAQHHVALLFTDITESKRMERMQEDFIGMVSHDLRSPMTALSGRAQLMKRRQQYDEAALDVIIGQAERVTRLVDDLRASVSMASGSIELRRAETDLIALAREAAGRLHGIASERTVRVASAHEALAGSWDGDRVSQVLDNLLDNAVRYAPDSSEIVVQVERTGDEARVSVVDTGPGIAASELPHLFDRFYRAGQDRSSPGMGLGLYISRMLVEAHGGRIWGTSTPGEGSVFTFALPIGG